LDSGSGLCNWSDSVRYQLVGFGVALCDAPATAGAGGGHDHWHDADVYGVQDVGGTVDMITLPIWVIVLMLALIFMSGFSLGMQYMTWVNAEMKKWLQ
jgi:hypothetical protein